MREVLNALLIRFVEIGNVMPYQVAQLLGGLASHWEKIDRIEVKDCNRYDCRFHHYNDLLHELVIEDTGQLCFI